MRRLITTDVFNAMRLIKISGTKDAFRTVAEKAKIEGMTTEEAGQILILTIIEGLANVGAEQKFYEFISAPLEMTVEEVASMELLGLINTLKEYAKIEDAEGWRSFFSSVAKVMN